MRNGIAHSKAKHRMWGVSFDQKKIHRVNQKLQLLKVSNLEKIGPKSDQNQSKIPSLIQEPRPALLSERAFPVEKRTKHNKFWAPAAG